MPNYKTFIQQNSERYEATSGCISAIRSYQEQVDSNLNTLLQFVSKNSDELNGELASLFVTDPANEDSKISIVLTDEQYYNCLHGEVETITAKTLSDMVTKEISADVILDSMEDSMSEMQIISAYIKGALDSTLTAAADLGSQIASKFKGISGSAISKYERLWDSSSPVQSIANLFNSINYVDCTIDGDGNIRIFSKTDYSVEDTAGIFEAMLKAKFAEYYQFIVDVLNDWTKIFNLISKIARGVVNIVKNLITTFISAPLQTNYVKGGQSIGILDVPIVQAPICDVYVQRTNDGLKVLYPATTGSPWMHKLYNDGVQNCNKYSIFNQLYTARSDNSVPTKQVYLFRKGWCRAELFASSPSLNMPAHSDITIFECEDAVMVNNISRSIIKVNDKGTAVELSPIDVVVPTSTIYPDYTPPIAHSAVKFCPADTLMRIGTVLLEDNGGEYIRYGLTLQLYPLIPYENIESYNDSQLACIWHDTAISLGYFFADNFWCVPGGSTYPSDTDFANFAYNFASRCVQVSSINREQMPANGTWPLVANMHLNSELKLIEENGEKIFGSDDIKDVFDDLLGTDSEIMQSCNILSILKQCVRYFSTSIKLYNSSGDEVKALPDGVIMSSYNIAEKGYMPIEDWFILSDVAELALICGYPRIGGGGPSTTIDYEQIFNNYIGDLSLYDMDLISFNEEKDSITQHQSTFLPYSKYYLYGVSIHYQTDYERIAELRKIILSTTVAIAGIALAVTFTVWSRKRMFNTQLAQAKVDKLSWDVAADPSAANIAEFRKARKTARRMTKINGILGISSSTDETVSILESGHAIANQLRGMQVGEDSTNDFTIKKLVDLIQG